MATRIKRIIIASLLALTAVIVLATVTSALDSGTIVIILQPAAGGNINKVGGVSLSSIGKLYSISKGSIGKIGGITK